MALRLLFFGMIAVISLRLKMERISSEKLGLTRITEHKRISDELKSAGQETVHRRQSDEFLTVQRLILIFSD
jgi:hypothetical protein